MRRPIGDGNGSSKGLIDVVPLSPGCSLFQANPQKPPPPGEMPDAIQDVFIRWMSEQPVRVRHTLPVVKDGNLVSLFVWWDRVEAPPG